MLPHSQKENFNNLMDATTATPPVRCNYRAFLSFFRFPKKCGIFYDSLYDFDKN
jgi:hypothetical protein